MPASGAATVRPIQACQRCRKFKVGCDRARPTCRRCAKSRSECVYVASDVSIAPGSAGEAHVQPRPQPPTELTPPTTESSHKDLSSRSASPPEEASASAASEGPYPCSSANFRSAELIPAKTHIRQPPKRDRAILSCIRCRKHKVRCDRRTPCGRCMKNNKESECIYSEFPGPEAPTEVEKPYKSLHGIATSFIDHRWDNRFRNVTHWTALLREIRLHLPQHIKPVEREDECATSINAMSLSINFPLGDLNDPSITVEDLLAQLPRRSVQRLFISYFMETVEKTFHIVDEAAYEQELRAFWMPGSVAQEDWLGVHFLILSLGCQAYNHHRVQKGLDVYPSLPARLLSGAEMCLKRTPFLFRPTLNVIKILSLMIIAKQIYAMSTHQADTCWHLTGMLVRLAASMGMHTDLAVSDEPTPYEEKTKRRMWTLAVYMEMKQSLVCGMPLLLRSSDIAALLKKEAFVDGNPGPIGGSGLGTTLHVGLLEETFASSGKLIAKAMELTTCVEDTVTYEEVVELDAALRVQLKRPETGLTRLHFSTGSVGSVDLETCMVDIFCRQTVMALHARFALQDQSSARYPVSYLSSLECALSVLSQQRMLCEGDPAAPSAWLSGLFRHEFFTAAMTVCFHLVRGHDMMSLPDGSSQPQEIMLDALQSCRDVWSRERNHSVCNANAYNIVNLLVTSLRESHEK
ncbi:C6 transcription factor [Akanthomyces lecanii RCEF 1005]|uniref:C6 transcription factor n=1 Tax=Akanthomyces lecanii RCEF 1005 TaxID=1081108 RepID=A0A168HNT5_CORDF|nr:C6 transcription factor [Akanthomyces lecanii RCEF 1005]